MHKLSFSVNVHHRRVGVTQTTLITCVSNWTRVFCGVYLFVNEVTATISYACVNNGGSSTNTMTQTARRMGRDCPRS